MMYVRQILPIALTGFALSTPRIASADCIDATICVKWESKLVDLEFGTREMEPLVPARGARITLIRPPPEPPLVGVLDQEGCLSFETSHASGHKLLIRAEAWVGDDPDDPVHIATARFKVKGEGAEPPVVWVLHFNDLVDNAVKTMDVPDDDTSPFPSLMAIATDVMHRFFELEVIPSNPPGLSILYLDYKGNGRSIGDQIEVGPDSFREKFLVAHEMGHWLRNVWNGATGILNYDYVALDAPCTFGIPEPKDYNLKPIMETDAQFHGLRSAEFGSSAMGEGQAHFIASVAFNTFGNGIPGGDVGGEFRYYKDIDIINFPDYATFVNDQDSIVSLQGDTDPNTLGGPNAWAATECSTNDWPTGDISTGMDWMRFFWRFLTMAGQSKPTLRQLMEFTQFTEAGFNMGVTDAYPVFLDAMSDANSGMTQFVGRFEAANTEMSVHDTN